MKVQVFYKSTLTKAKQNKLLIIVYSQPTERLHFLYNDTTYPECLNDSIPLNQVLFLKSFARKNQLGIKLLEDLTKFLQPKIVGLNSLIYNPSHYHWLTENPCAKQKRTINQNNRMSLIVIFIKTLPDLIEITNTGTF